MSYAINDVVNEVFRFADRNRNGRLETGAAAPQVGASARGAVPNETRLGLGDRLMLSTAAQVKRFPLPGGDLARFVPLADSNRDGALTREEARAFLTRLDANHDGRLDDQEIRTNLRAAMNGTLR